jgi:hypothetical protein
LKTFFLIYRIIRRKFAEKNEYSLFTCISIDSTIMTTVTRRGVKSTLSNNDNTSYDKSNDGDPYSANMKEYDSDDDKGTRLTLMEEVLLLGLKDREVC